MSTHPRPPTGPSRSPWSGPPPVTTVLTRTRRWSKLTGDGHPLEVTTVDVRDPAGQDLMRRHGAGISPLVLVDRRLLRRGPASPAQAGPARCTKCAERPSLTSRPAPDDGKLSLPAPVLAAFLAGGVALFAPCCIVFLAPRYLGGRGEEPTLATAAPDLRVCRRARARPGAHHLGHQPGGLRHRQLPPTAVLRGSGASCSPWRRSACPGG